MDVIGASVGGVCDVGDRRSIWTVPIEVDYRHGLNFWIFRYILYATNSAWLVLIGLSFHGFAFTLTHISSQIYLAERVAPEWRTRAQALLSLMTAGVGNLVGYFLTATWLAVCTTNDEIAWFTYWGGLGAIVLAVFGYFLVGYRGKT